MPKLKKVALYFGSFNPIHIGHLIIAQSIINNFPIDELWFVVSPRNPLKDKKSLISEYQRLYMVKEAIEDNPRFRASDIEFGLSKPSYTVHTLAYLCEKYPDTVFYLIMGEDNLSNLHQWKNVEYIMEHFEILVYPRLGYMSHNLYQHPHIHLIKSPIIEISSSQIRAAIRQRQSVQYLLSDKVLKYIEDMNLYK